jgi:hypothetical protein
VTGSDTLPRDDGDARTGTATFAREYDMAKPDHPNHPEHPNVPKGPPDNIPRPHDPPRPPKDREVG